MPVVVVRMLEGRSKEQKSRLVQEITRAMAEIAGADPQNVHVVIEEAVGENWGRAGVLLSDTPREESESRRGER